MIKNFALPLLVTVAAYLAFGANRDGAKAGLLEGAIPSAEEACAGVTLSRGLKYGDDEQNVLDVATSSEKPSMPRPVFLFVAGESFANDGTSADWTMRDQAMCLSAHNGMVGVSMSYRRAPAHDWPAGARDIAGFTRISTCLVATLARSWS